MDQNATKQAILERCHDILLRWGDAILAAEEAEKRKTAISQEYTDCHAAARLFGFDLVAEYSAYTSRLVDQQAVQANVSVTVARATANAEARPAVPVIKQKTIREF